MYQGGVCVFFVQNADLKLQLRDLQAKITALSERQVRAALWENTCCRISVLCELHVCLDQFDYLGSESPLGVLRKQGDLVRFWNLCCIMALFCVVLCWTFVVWFVRCGFVLPNEQFANTHTRTNLFSPFIWHFNNWWLLSGDDYVAYCPLLELTVQNPKFCGGDGEKMRCRQWRGILISVSKLFKVTEQTGCHQQEKKHTWNHSVEKKEEEKHKVSPIITVTVLKLWHSEMYQPAALFNKVHCLPRSHTFGVRWNSPRSKCVSLTDGGGSLLKL